MSTSLNSRLRAEGWRPNYNNVTLYPSKKRPFEKRNATSFKRPPAVYDNVSREDHLARVEAMKVPKRKRKLAS